MGLFHRFKKGLDKAKHIVSEVKHGSDNLFNKGTVGGTKLFGAGSVGSHILRDVSKGTNAAKQVAGSISTHLNKTLNNPLISGMIGSIPIVGEGALAGLHGIADAAGAAKSVLKATSDATKQKNYSGGFDQVADQVAKHLSNVASTILPSGEGAPPNPMGAV